METLKKFPTNPLSVNDALVEISDATGLTDQTLLQKMPLLNGHEGTVTFTADPQALRGGFVVTLEGKTGSEYIVSFRSNGEPLLFQRAVHSKTETRSPLPTAPQNVNTALAILKHTTRLDDQTLIEQMPLLDGHEGTVTFTADPQALRGGFFVTIDEQTSPEYVVSFTSNGEPRTCSAADWS